ncbi:HEAT repeat domain-containing protein [Deltaproteobacteria bacterium TL4]
MLIKIQTLLLSTLLILMFSACSSLEDAERLHKEGNKEKALSVAESYLGSSEKSERLRAAKLIGEIGLKQGGKALQKHLKDPDQEVQVAVIRSLGLLAYEPATEDLIGLVSSARDEVFEAIGKAIRSIGPKAVQALVDKFYAPSEQTNKDQIKKMLVYIGKDVTDAITMSMKNKSYYDNQGSFEVLIAIKNPMVAQMMLPYLEDEEVAHLVVEGLTKLGPLAVDAVLQKLNVEVNHTDNDILVERLVKTLGQLKDPRALPTLEALSQHNNELIRIAVDRALFQIRGF